MTTSVAVVKPNPARATHGEVIQRHFANERKATRTGKRREAKKKGNPGINSQDPGACIKGLTPIQGPGGSSAFVLQRSQDGWIDFDFDA